MKKKLVLLGAALLLSSATASAQSPVYITGNVPGLTATWTPEESATLTYSDGVYTYDIAVTRAGLATAKAKKAGFPLKIEVKR